MAGLAKINLLDTNGDGAIDARERSEGLHA